MAGTRKRKRKMNPMILLEGDFLCCEACMKAEKEEENEWLKS